MKCLKSFQGLFAKEEADPNIKLCANKFLMMTSPVYHKDLRTSNSKQRINMKMFFLEQKMKCTKLTMR